MDANSQIVLGVLMNVYNHSVEEHFLLQVSHIAVTQGQVRNRPGGLLLEALMALPDLAGRH